MATNNSPNFLTNNALSIERLQDDDIPSGYDFNRIVDALTGLRNGVTTINANNSGVILSPTGLVAINPAGQTTFSLDAATGNVTISVPSTAAPGVGTIVVNDGTYDRAAMGSLAAYTGPNGVASPAQFGFRAVGPDGNTIFDSLGLMAVMSLLSSKLNTGGQSLAGLGGGGDVLISSISFTLPRPLRVMLIACSAGLVNTSAGPIQLAESVVCKIDGVYSLDAQGFVSCFGPVPAGNGTSQTLIQAPQLSAGPHTIDFVWVSGSIFETFTDFADSLFAFQLGG